MPTTRVRYLGLRLERLENVFQPELDIPRRVRLSADPSKRSRCINVRSRRSKDHAVEDVEELGAELQLVSLPDAHPWRQV